MDRDGRETLSDDGEERLRNLADNLPNGMVYQLLAEGSERRFLYVSKGVEPLFGVHVARALADAGSLYGRILPQYLPVLAEAETKALANLSPFYAEVEIEAGSPHLPKWVQISSAPRRRPDGLLIWDGFVLDITARKRAELAHLDAERNLALATEAAAIGVWHWDIETGAITYSQRAKEIYGFPPDTTITYDRLRAQTVEEDLDPARQVLSRALDPAIRSNDLHRYRIRRADTGEVRHLLAHGGAKFEQRRDRLTAVSYVGTLQDVTEATRSEEALRESESRLRLAVAAGEMAVWELDIATDTLTPSPELNRVYGFPAEARPSIDDFRARYAPGEQERIQSEGAAALTRGETQFQVEARHIWPDGTVRWLAIRAQIVMVDGRPARAVGVVMDNTERRTAEDRLKVVARELQHRVKNTLTVVQTLAGQTFRPDRPYDDAMRAFNGRLRALAAATDVMTKNDWADVGLRELIERVTGPYREPGSDAVACDGPDIRVDSKTGVSVGMALHELSTNAVKYGALSMPGGKVSITWSQDGEAVDLFWKESGGPPVIAPTVRGFGTRLLEKGLFDPSVGAVSVAFEPAGVICRIRSHRSSVL